MKRFLYFLLVFAYLMLAPIFSFDLPDFAGAHTYASNGALNSR